MSAPLHLFCLVYGQPFARAIDVEIEGGKYVSHLKKLIKAASGSELDGIHSNDLDLYEVELPMTRDETPQKPELSNNNKMHPGETLASVFQVDPPEGNIHIIIEAVRWKRKPAPKVSVIRSCDDRIEAARFSYGVQSYGQILMEDLFFVAHMKLFRSPPSHCLFLCRPKRHGKTLLCSLTQSFYDIRDKPHFSAMFPGVDTSEFIPQPSSFMVLPLKFAALQPSQLGSSRCGLEFEKNFQMYLRLALEVFCRNYGLSIPAPPQDALVFFQEVVDFVETLKYPMMIIVDEYDSSVNSALLSTKADHFREYLKRRTSGYFRFFTVLKQALQVDGNHALVVGITPLAICDFTSGFNTCFDMTWNSKFQDVCGIAIDDISPVLNSIAKKYDWDIKTKEQFNTKLKEFYDGYQFGGNSRIFNSGQVVNALQHIDMFNSFPNPPIDRNTDLSDSVLRFLSECKNESFCQLLMDLLTDKVKFHLSTCFSIDTVRNQLNTGDTDTLLSLMVYYGALTVDILDKTTYAKIPNNVAREVFVTRLLANLQARLDSKGEDQLYTAVQEFLLQFNPAPLINLLNSPLLPAENYSDVHHSLESTFKTRFQVLVLAGLPVTERNRLINEFCLPQGQADTVVFPQNNAGAEHPLILIEFKNTPIRDLVTGATGWENQIKQSEKFIIYDDYQMKQLRLKQSTCQPFKTISARLDDAVQKLQVNAQKLQGDFPDRAIIGFVMYRVGLHRVLHERVDFQTAKSKC